MKNKDPHRRLTKLANDLGYEVTYRIETKIGPYTIATARLTVRKDDGLWEEVVTGYGISRCSTKDKQNDTIGNQVAIGKAMTAAIWKAVDSTNEEGDLYEISVLMA